MKTVSNSLRLFMSAASLVCFATYAADSFSSERLDGSFRTDISNRASIIGDLDWEINEVPEKYAKTMLSVGTVLRRGPNASAAVGTLIYDSDNHKHYVLTAKHVIYDPETRIKRAGDVYLGFEYSQQSYSLDTNSLSEEMPAGGDYILVQVLGAPRSRGVPVSDIADTVIESSGDAVMLSVLLYERNAYRIVQQNVQLDSFLRSVSWYSDLDAVVGMSGSPVFIEAGSRLKIVGILTSVTPNKCEKSRPFCSNKVTRVSRP